MATRAEKEREGRIAFAVLKPLCSKLLELSSSQPNDAALLLDSLAGALRDVSQLGLELCMDYVLFPLLCILDAAVACRSSITLMTDQGRDNKYKGPLVIGDAVAEGVLSCTELVLQRCPAKTTSQSAVLLRKLTTALMLSAVEAAEEFRHGAVKCLKAYLQSLQPCDAPFCACKLPMPSPFVTLKQDNGNYFDRWESCIRPSEEANQITYGCAMGVLQSTDMSAAVGHMISLLLQIAEKEAARGGLGSGKLRQDAIATLHVLCLKVGRADSLAFFLPGVASGLVKVMSDSRPRNYTVGSPFASAIPYSSGAAGWPGAVEEAIRALTDAIVIVLADVQYSAESREISDVCSREGGIENGSAIKVQRLSATEALQALHVVKECGSAGGNEGNQNVVVEEAGIVSQQKSLSVGDVSFLKKERGSVPDFVVVRNKEWLANTAARLSNIMGQSWPLLCAHSSPAVRIAVLEASVILLWACSETLEILTATMLECLLALAFDELEQVAEASQNYISLLLSSDGLNENKVLMRGREGRKNSKHWTVEKALDKLLLSLLNRLPQMVFSADAAVAVLHAQRLAAAMYFIGPTGVSSCLLNSSVTRALFLKVMNQCLSFNTAFTGSLDSIISYQVAFVSSESPSKHCFGTVGFSAQGELVPTMPPWLGRGPGSKIYDVLSCILRLAGLSVVENSRGPSIELLVEPLLTTLRQVATDVGTAPEDIELVRHSKGNTLRIAATSVCILNELMFGASGRWNERLSVLLGRHMIFKDLMTGSATNSNIQDSSSSNKQGSMGHKGIGRLPVSNYLHKKWLVSSDNELRRQRLNNCARNILHDYMVWEIWECHDVHVGGGDIRNSFQPWQDSDMLQKVLIEGVGVLGIALGKSFEDAGFLGLVLLPLLEKLGSKTYDVRIAADATLQVLCSACDYETVRGLVVANADCIVDALCQQFRHLTLHPNVPNLLAAILRYTGSSQDFLPLLGEPVSGILLELEVLSRRNHPQFTVPLLRCLQEITRAAKAEGGVMLSRSSKACVVWRSLLDQQNIEDKASQVGNHNFEQMICQAFDRRRSTESVAVVTTSCLLGCAPLLSSSDPQTCLLALETVEGGVAALSKMEEAAAHEKEERKLVEELWSKLKHDQALTDFMPVNDATSGSNKLLSSMHQVWPHLVLCLRHKHASVVVRALDTIASVTFECGGDFFARRFHKDALPVMVQLLQDGALSKQQVSQKLFVQQRNIQMLDSAPAAVLKVQEAVLRCITAIASRKKSSTSLGVSFDLVAAWVVKFSCQGDALKEVGSDAVMSLCAVDADIIWLLLMDLVYSGDTKENYNVPASCFPKFNEIFSPCSSKKDALSLWCPAHESKAKGTNKEVAQKLLAKVEAYNLPV